MAIAVLIGYFNVSLSPWLESANSEEPYSMVRALEWFVRYQDGISPIDNCSLRMDRLPGAITSYSGSTSNTQENIYEVIPLHLGYDKYATYREAYPKDHYIVIPQQAYGYYVDRIPQYPSQWLWTLDDLDELHNGFIIDEIYTSSNFEIMYVNSATVVQ